ncbi:hypothetical protein Hanom_Chr16g01447611 [Helianthus anomalus]
MLLLWLSLWGWALLGWAGDIRGWRVVITCSFSRSKLVVWFFLFLWSIGTTLFLIPLINLRLWLWGHLRCELVVMSGIDMCSGVIRKDQLGGLSLRCSPLWIPSPMLETRLGVRNLIYINMFMGLGWCVGWDRLNLVMMADLGVHSMYLAGAECLLHQNCILWRDRGNCVIMRRESVVAHVISGWNTIKMCCSRSLGQGNTFMLQIINSVSWGKMVMYYRLSGQHKQDRGSLLAKGYCFVLLLLMYEVAGGMKRRAYTGVGVWEAWIYTSICLFIQACCHLTSCMVCGFLISPIMYFWLRVYCYPHSASGFKICGRMLGISKFLSVVITYIVWFSVFWCIQMVNLLEIPSFICRGSFVIYVDPRLYSPPRVCCVVLGHHGSPLGLLLRIPGVIWWCWDYGMVLIKSWVHQGVIGFCCFSYCCSLLLLPSHDDRWYLWTFNLLSVCKNMEMKLLRQLNMQIKLFPAVKKTGVVHGLMAWMPKMKDWVYVPLFLRPGSVTNSYWVLISMVAPVFFQLWALFGIRAYDSRKYSSCRSEFLSDAHEYVFGTGAVMAHQVVHVNLRFCPGICLGWITRLLCFVSWISGSSVWLRVEAQQTGPTMYLPHLDLMGL